MSSKPPQLEEARSLLREALTVEELGLSRFVGRAATLQQLARVAERRGDRAAALGHLQDALYLPYYYCTNYCISTSVLTTILSTQFTLLHLQDALGLHRRAYGEEVRCRT